MIVCFQLNAQKVKRTTIAVGQKRTVCPTWNFLSDTVTHFSTCVVIKVKRTESSRKQLSGRKPGQRSFVFFEVYCHL